MNSPDVKISSFVEEDT
jgi:hypothetical protein